MVIFVTFTKDVGIVNKDFVTKRMVFFVTVFERGSILLANNVRLFFRRMVIFRHKIFSKN